MKGIVAAQRIPALLLVAYLAHFAEEWYGEITSWARVALGYEVGIERLLLLNGIAFALFSICAAASIRAGRITWFTVSFATLLGMNGMLHTLATIGLGRYSPGTITGLALYIPLSIFALRSSAAQLDGIVFRRAVVAGAMFHVLVTFLAIAG